LRAGPLSNSEVIGILNSSFVPVYAANQDYVDAAGKAPPAEKAERQRIYGTFLSQKFGAGDVHIYIVTGDGVPVEGLEVAKATEQDNLLVFLRRVAARLEVQPGPPAVPPHMLSVPPTADADAMIIHTVARGANRGSWREFPGENWTVLAPAEWRRLLPPSPAKAGDQWDVEPAVARKLLTNFYPQTEDTNDQDRNLIDECSLHMRAMETVEGVARVRVEGVLQMRRRGAPGKGGYGIVSAKVLGFLYASADNSRIRRFSLTTADATYAQEAFSVAQHYIPPESIDLLRRN
jgi:hypothetical protein